MWSCCWDGISIYVIITRVIGCLVGWLDGWCGGAGELVSVDGDGCLRKKVLTKRKNKKIEKIEKYVRKCVNKILHIYVKTNFQNKTKQNNYTRLWYKILWTLILFGEGTGGKKRWQINQLSNYNVA